MTAPIHIPTDVLAANYFPEDLDFQHDSQRIYAAGKLIESYAGAGRHNFVKEARRYYDLMRIIHMAAAENVENEQLYQTIIIVDTVIDQCSAPHHAEMLRMYMAEMLGVYKNYAKLLTDELSEFSIYLIDRYELFVALTAIQITGLTDTIRDTQRAHHDAQAHAESLRTELARQADQARQVEDECKFTADTLRSLEEQFAALMENAKQMAKYVKFKQKNLDPKDKMAAAAQWSDEEESFDETPAQHLARLKEEAQAAKTHVVQIAAQHNARLPPRRAAQNRKATAFILSCATTMRDHDGLPLYTFTMVAALPDVPEEARDHGLDPRHDDFYSWTMVVNEKSLPFPAYYMHVYENAPQKLLALQVAVEFSRPMRKDEFDRLSGVLLAPKA